MCIFTYIHNYVAIYSYPHVVYACDQFSFLAACDVEEYHIDVPAVDTHRSKPEVCALI